MIQNKAASSAAQTAANGGIPYNVSGKIDKNYNYNYRQYLKKRCRIADYDLKNGRKFGELFAGNPRRGLQALCCTTDCPDGAGNGSHALTYKRSNWGFRKQGAVDNNLYISKQKYVEKNCCPCPCEQIIDLGQTGGAEVVIGATVTSGASSAAGTIIEITQETFTVIRVSLDDCDSPFTNADSGNIRVSGVSYTLSTINPAILTAGCPQPDGRRPQYQPQDPAYNPKNYNKVAN